MKYVSIGGQAIMEGVMMRSNTSMAMSVRRSDGTITIEKKHLSQSPWRKKVAKIPLVRGCVAFVDSLVQGMQITSKSAELYGEDAMEELEPSKFETWLSEKLHIKAETIAIVLGVLLGLVLTVGLFMFLPQLLRKLLFSGLDTSAKGTLLLVDLFEGLIKIAIFIGYIAAISFLKDIKRLFMYHGAEHKVISCYEHGDELTVENARKYSTSHPRCGTSFIFIVMAVGILTTAIADHLFGLSTVDMAHFLVRLAVKLALLPVVAGVSYEILKGLAKSDNLCFRILRSPGMALQKLTTRQPDDTMLEVSLTSFKTVLIMDGLMEEPVVETSVEEGPAETVSAEETPAEDVSIEESFLEEAPTGNTEAAPESETDQSEEAGACL